MKTGCELTKEIDEKKVTSGSLCFWWLGQQSFVVKTETVVFYLDPYLSGHEERLVPPLLEPFDVANADYITGSHDHSDHIDHEALPGMLAANPRAKLIVPRCAGPGLEAEGIDMSRVVMMNDEQVHEDGPVRITAIKAAHELFDYVSGTGYPYLGYVIEADGVVIYHSGDTCIYDGLASRLKSWNITVAFLPINGRDARRLKAGCIGNMTYQEAVDLAGAVCPKLTVPAHYEMFSFNSEDPRLFAEYMDVKFPELKYWIGEHGTAVGVL
jgi:L-ascorbate metabolism protein UlaG (beta-lactamase superfamily)